MPVQVGRSFRNMPHTRFASMVPGRGISSSICGIMKRRYSGPGTSGNRQALAHGDAVPQHAAACRSAELRPWSVFNVSGLPRRAEESSSKAASTTRARAGRAQLDPPIHARWRIKASPPCGPAQNSLLTRFWGETIWTPNAYVLIGAGTVEHEHGCPDRNGS